VSHLESKQDGNVQVCFFFLSPEWFTRCTPKIKYSAILTAELYLHMGKHVRLCFPSILFCICLANQIRTSHSFGWKDVLLPTPQNT